eukprot:GCRY01002135.1.p1 GENE.GCRY01002135.1~~GCRY01002135.1.p1  ORF type:complete len:226 (+),score=36.29 GCRY01002135.1:252-929(+)
MTEHWEVTPHLYFGTAKAAEDKDLLETLKISHIVNVGTDSPNFFPKEFKYHKVNVVDSPTTSLDIYYPEATEFIKNAIKDDGIVFVHCLFAISLSPCFVFAYLIEYGEFTLWDAYQRVLMLQPKLNINLEFWKQLSSYESKVKGKRSLKVKVEVIKGIEKFEIVETKEKSKKKKRDKQAGNLRFKDAAAKRIKLEKEEEERKKQQHMGARTPWGARKSPTDKFCW